MAPSQSTEISGTVKFRLDEACQAIKNGNSLLYIIDCVECDTTRGVMELEDKGGSTEGQQRRVRSGYLSNCIQTLEESWIKDASPCLILTCSL